MVRKTIAEKYKTMHKILIKINNKNTKILIKINQNLTFAFALAC